jgi:hypothetical protein
MYLIGFPLLLVPFAIYNIVAFLMPSVSWAGALATIHMKSGADWTMSGGDVLIVLAVLLLFVEMVKVVRAGSRGIVDHGLSLLLLAAMLAEFVLVQRAASATFFLIVVLSFFDLLGGFVLSSRSAPRTVMIDRSEPVPEPVAPAPEKTEEAPKSAEHIPS